MLKNVKRAVLRAARASGALSLLSGSSWRRQRLLILCYHSLAVDEEHLWNPTVFFTHADFRRRLDLLQQCGAHVLPLGEALRRLHDGDLPPRSVSLTFDDGTADFASLAWPELKARNLPATVYVTSYYADKQLPVFSLMVSYLLWKARHRNLPAITDIPEFQPFAGAGLSDASLAGRLSTIALAHAVRHEWSASRRNEFAGRLAALLDIDYPLLLRKRVLQIMDAAEVARIAKEGADVQLHTHRHRTPAQRNLFDREIADNRAWLERSAGTGPTKHFCYPSGVVAPEFPGWLAANRVETAVTCIPGLADRNSSLLQLPRLVDTSNLDEVEFESWLSGAAAFLPHRKLDFSPGPDAAFAAQQTCPPMRK
jgi:peptidoglycan/xylan/chitin deacetylase (PgdA/CDA1 family)